MNPAFLRLWPYNALIALTVLGQPPNTSVRPQRGTGGSPQSLIRV